MRCKKMIDLPGKPLLYSTRPILPVLPMLPILPNLGKADQESLLCRGSAHSKLLDRSSKALTVLRQAQHVNRCCAATLTFSM